MDNAFKVTYMQTQESESPDYLEKTVEEIDLDLTKLDYLYTYIFGFVNKLRYFLSGKRRRTVKIRFLQLDFIAKVIELSKKLNPENKAYLVLGAIHYAQGRWGRFPKSGPLYELTLKQKDLEQVLSANATEINLEGLLDNPNLVMEKADEKFAEFFGEHYDLKMFSQQKSTFYDFLKAAKNSKS